MVHREPSITGGTIGTIELCEIEQTRNPGWCWCWCWGGGGCQHTKAVLSKYTSFEGLNSPNQKNRNLRVYGRRLEVSHSPCYCLLINNSAKIMCDDNCNLYC